GSAASTGAVRSGRSNVNQRDFRQVMDSPPRKNLVRGNGKSQENARAAFNTVRWANGRKMAAQISKVTPPAIVMSHQWRARISGNAASAAATIPEQSKAGRSGRNSPCPPKAM